MRAFQISSAYSHVSWITTTTWDFFSSSRDLTKSVCVRGHICQDDQDVLLQLISVVFSSGQSKTRSNDTFDAVNDKCERRKGEEVSFHFRMYAISNFSKPATKRVWNLNDSSTKNSRRIISQVQEQSDSIQTTVLFEVLFEESSSFQIDSHCSKDD